jgi:peptidoglycan lytic transglycosylase
MKTTLLCAALLGMNFQIRCTATESTLTACGVASWYGEDHRGRPMANCKPFNPDRLTAASWFYPLGTKLRVTSTSSTGSKTVIVTVTDRGPSKTLVRDGRIIDLTHAAFKRLAHPNLGLVEVTVQPVRTTSLTGSTEVAGR